MKQNNEQKHMQEKLTEIRMDAAAEKNKKRVGKRLRFSKHLRLLMMLGATAALTAGTAASLAYWTDRVETTASVGTLSIGIDYGDEAIQLLGDGKLLPGDVVPFTFEVKNSGQISADIRPVIQISSSAPMQKDKTGYHLVTKDGADASDQFELAFRNGETPVENPETETYDTIQFTSKEAVTLAGSVQNDPEEDKDEASGKVLHEKEFTYYLKLHEKSDNAFMGSTAELQVSTYAIQHRNTEGITEQTDWIAAGEQNGGTELK